jgi:hypothetical protein
MKFVFLFVFLYFCEVRRKIFESNLHEVRENFRQLQNGDSDIQNVMMG